MRSFSWLAPFVALLFACSSEGGPESAADSPEATSTTDIALSASSEPLASFDYDTGLIPAGAPAQVQLKLSAGGGVKIEATGKPSAKGLEGKKGSGKVAIDLHVKLDGRLKADATGTDGDLPGLKDIDIAIKGETSFDPFLVGDGQEAKLDAKIPAADLPEIPLGATPGKLRLSVVEGSVLRSKFAGSCVSVSNQKATYAGALTTSGTLILKGTLALEMLGLEKSFDLGQIEVPIPELTAPLDFAAKDAKGAKDGSDGARCGGAKPSDAAKSDGDVPASVTPEKTPTAPSAPDETTCRRDANGSLAAASDIGSASDTDTSAARQKTVMGSIGGSEEAWFALVVRDEGINGNPTVTATVDDPSLEVLLDYECMTKPNYSTCATGEADADHETACRALRSVSLDTSCSSTTESGTAFIRVRSTDRACHAYALTVTVE